MSAINYPFRDRDVFLERFVTGINHNRTVKTGIDAIVTGLFIAMIKMDGENCIRKNLFRRSNHGFEHTFVGVTSGPF